MTNVTAPTTEAGRRLLRAASELFYRHGITAIGVAGIAEAAGVTKKTLYDCFGSKAGLVTAYLGHRDELWWAGLHQRVEQTPPPRALAVFAAYRAQSGLQMDRGCAFQRGAAELDPTHPGWAVVVEHKRRVRAELARLLRFDISDDALGEAGVEDLADHLYLLLEGAAFQRGLDGDPSALDRATDRARRLVTTAGSA